MTMWTNQPKRIPNFEIPSCVVFSGLGQGIDVRPPPSYPHGTKRLRPICHIRRWRCSEGLCARCAFTEHVALVRTRSRRTA